MKTFVMSMSLAVLLGGCATNNGANVGSMNDREIFAVVREANQGEVQHGQLATQRATAASVRQFAQMMIADHTAALQRLETISGRVGVTAADTSLSTDLRNNAARTTNVLESLRGAEFDRLYMRSQIEMHQWLLTSIDTSFLTAAGSRPLREELRTMRASVAAHLDQARQIAGTL